jgi:hypothetical protein
MSGTIIFDIDGTLVDSNYQHALAWYRALRRYHAGKLGVPTFAVRTGGFSKPNCAAPVRSRSTIHSPACRPTWAGSSPATYQGFSESRSASAWHSRKRTCACAAAVA